MMSRAITSEIDTGVKMDEHDRLEPLPKLPVYEEVIAQASERKNEAHFKVKAHLDGPLVDAEIVVDRARNLVKVREKRGRKFWSLPLQVVAELVYHRAIKEEMSKGMAREAR